MILNLHGDALDLLGGLADRSVPLVLTDIPYNISQKSNGLRRLDFGDWDKLDGEERRWIAEMIRVTAGSCVVFCSDKQLSHILLQMEAEGLITRTLIWRKTNPTVLNCDKLYTSSIEVAAFGKRPGATFNPACRACVFDHPIVSADRMHPTQKPVAIMQEIIEDLTAPGDLVVDPFMGSGTTGVAAVQSRRRFMGAELVDEYYAAASARIYAATVGISGKDVLNGQLGLFEPKGDDHDC